MLLSYMQLKDWTRLDNKCSMYCLISANSSQSEIPLPLFFQLLLLPQNDFSKFTMRLLNCTTMRLEDHLGPKTPDYAILSHTWEEEEILFEDLQNSPRGKWENKKGARKVLDSISEARRLDLSYIWIDTCCIDKRSSAELSEAINSMFNWYMRSSVCIAYLSDVASINSFAQSKWFTRGWTLQELIAPWDVRFYDSNWTYLGDRRSLADAIANVTSIAHSLLGRTSRGLHRIEHIKLSRLYSHSISDRMSWASRRQTTRPEDIAYCLMGLFDVNMPLLYGEGAEKAFLRLQQTILEGTDDHSILCFSKVSKTVNGRRYFVGDPLLAPSPAFFDLPCRVHRANASHRMYDLQRPSHEGRLGTTKRNELQVGMLLGPVARWRTTPPILHLDRGANLVMGVLNCEVYHDGEPPSRPVIILVERQGIFMFARNESGSCLPICLLRTSDPIIAIADISMEDPHNLRSKETLFSA